MNIGKYEPTFMRPCLLYRQGIAYTRRRCAKYEKETGTVTGDGSTILILDTGKGEEEVV